MKRILPLLAALLPLPTLSAVPPTLDPTYGVEIPTAAPDSTTAPVSAWIWDSPQPNSDTVSARGTFQLSQLPKATALYATADDGFEISVNGHQVGASPLPVVPSGWANVQRFAVADQLTVGRNVVAVRAVNQGGAAGVLVRLDADDHPILVTDDHWRVSKQTDLPAEWTGAAFDDTRWTPATVVAPYGQGPWGNHLNNWPGGPHEEARYLAHKVIPLKSAQAIAGAAQMAGLETLAAGTAAQVKISPAADGATKPVLLVDFGQELAGRVQVWGTDGAAVTITTGESREECDHKEPALNNNGPFDLKLAGSEPASTRYTAFRYAKLTFPNATPLEITRLVCDHKYYPVKYQGTFDCSDPLLTRIWYTGAYTAHLCMQETIWDAPKRDRGLWIGDLRVTGQTINTVFADRFLMEKSIHDVRENEQKGRPATELPARNVNGIPGYSAAWFCTLADYYRHLGNREFLASQHEKIISLLKFQQTEFDAQNAFVPGKMWDFCDWAPGFKVDSPLARETTRLYIIQGVREAVFLLRELGDAASANQYTAWADQLTTAARARTPDPGTHLFSKRLQENAMAVLSDTAKPDEYADIYAQVLRANSPAWTATPAAGLAESEAMSPYYGYFVLGALEKLGQHQAGVDLIRHYWGKMLGRGTAAWWEEFDPSWPENMGWVLDRMNYLSLCHGWSSGPTPFLTETVLGVRPTGAGYKTAEIRPQLGDLTWAEGDVPTPGGLIHVRVERKNNQVVVGVTLPPGVTATILLNGHSVQANQAAFYSVIAP